MGDAFIRHFAIRPREQPNVSPGVYRRLGPNSWENRCIVPRTCTICKHPKRLQIERAIVAGESLRDIAGQYGTAKTSVARHRTHVTEAIARSREARESVRTGTLLEDVRAGERRAEWLYEQAEEILTTAIKNQDPRTALQAIRAASAVMGEARGHLELRGELTNELGRDKAPTAMSIQIVTSSAVGELPRVSFAAPDQLEIAAAPTDEEDPVAEIGLNQLR